MNNKQGRDEHEAYGEGTGAKEKLRLCKQAMYQYVPVTARTGTTGENKITLHPLLRHYRLHHQNTKQLIEASNTKQLIEARTQGSHESIVIGVHQRVECEL